MARPFFQGLQIIDILSTAPNRCVFMQLKLLHCHVWYGKVHILSNLETANHVSCGHHRHLTVDKILTHDYHVTEYLTIKGIIVWCGIWLYG